MEHTLDMNSESLHTIQKGTTQRVTREHSELCQIKDWDSGKDRLKNA